MLALAAGGCSTGPGPDGSGTAPGKTLPGGPGTVTPPPMSSGFMALPTLEGELLVQFQPGVLVEGAPPAALLAAYDLDVRRCSAALDACALTFDPSARPAWELAAALRGESIVAAAGPAYLCEAAASTPDPDLTPIQWNLYALDLVDAETPVDDDLGATIVALLDTGVFPVPGLAGVPLVSPYDFVNDDSDATDDHKHGTHLAGVLSDATPGVGTSAVSPGLAIMPVKVLDAFANGTELDLADGILWAVDHGAAVINMSLAFPPGYYPSKTLQTAIAYAESAGVIMVAAAGNLGLDVVAYPAAFRSVIAVGASKVDAGIVPSDTDLWSDFLDPDGLLRAPYSNYGGKLDVLAPGGVLTEDLNGDTVTDAILAQTFDIRFGVPQVGYWLMAGTSHSSAHVASLVARALANFPGLTADELRVWLDKYSSAGGDNGNDEFDPEFGFGFIDGDGLLRKAARANNAPNAKSFYAGVMVTLHDDGLGGTMGKAVVEVKTGKFKAARNVTVIGAWIGAASGNVIAIANRDGIANFTSPSFVPGGCAIGFQVEAIVFNHGRNAMHPHGFVGITLDSLNLLQSSAAQIMGDLPTIFTFPSVALPGLIGSVTLANFGPGLTTPPTAVAVEVGCFGTNFPSLSGMTVNASGQLAGDAPAEIDVSSFAVAVTAPAVTFPGVSLRVVTFDEASDENPLHIDGGSDRASALQDALDDWWAFYTAGGALPAASSDLSADEMTALGVFVAGYLSYLAGDEDESIDLMSDVVSSTAIALPTGTTASSAYVGAIEYLP